MTPLLVAVLEAELLSTKKLDSLETSKQSLALVFGVIGAVGGVNGEVYRAVPLINWKLVMSP